MLKLRINEFIYIELCGGTILIGRYKDALCLKWSADIGMVDWLFNQIIERSSKGIQDVPLKGTIYDDKHTIQLTKLSYQLIGYE